jgi:putative transposase
MAHSYVCSYYHCIWSTKERRQLISADLQERLWPYRGGIARENRFQALAIGGHFRPCAPLVVLASYACSRQSFQEEFLAFLKKHGVDYDPRFVWG